MLCKNCGTDIINEGLYCTTCGQAVDLAPVVQPIAKSKKISAKNILIPLLVFVVIFGIFSPFMSPMDCSTYTPYILINTVPEIKYGEFPFRLEYEINGQAIVIEDTIICKHNGHSGGNWWSNWNASLTSGEQEKFSWTMYNQAIYLKIDDVNNICFLLGSADHYMGLYKFYNVLGNEHDYDSYQVRAFQIVGSDFPVSATGAQLISDDELLNKYGIRIISWEPSPPIENSIAERG